MTATYDIRSEVDVAAAFARAEWLRVVNERLEVAS